VIYNAVSANQDGLNEFFQILCMEYFLNNNVKIFNRAGLLVYEQNYYDPTDPGRRFEGISNKGASIAGTELPIGTYFYVVDKSDNSKPKVGYLELNR
jgi:gliding motility-associated-like protein